MANSRIDASVQKIMDTESSTATKTEVELERNLGTQPLDAVLQEHQLSNHDLVAQCEVGLNHKNIQRARKGRRLTPKMKVRITETLNALLRQRKIEQQFGVRDLFNY